MTPARIDGAARSGGDPPPRARLTVWGERECARLHDASCEILERSGVEVRHERGLDLLRQAGARVADTRARLPRGLVDRALASAPRSFPLKGRAPDGSLDLTLAQGNTYFGSGPDCLYVRDAASGERRRATLVDVEDMAGLSERLPNIDFVMSMGLPEDAANEIVDVAQFAAMVKGTRKPIVVSSPFGGDSMRVMRKMAAACGEAASFACLAMSSPPLMLDEVAVDKSLVCGELGIPLVLAPAPSAGSTAPASITAVVAVANAEVLAGLCIHQLANPGAPFVYGVGVGVLNMRTTVEAYCAPEGALGHQAMADLAIRYGLPSWHYAGDSDAKSLDEQWSLEAAVSTLLGALSRATLLHDVGYLESGLQSAFDSLVLGDELAGFARAFLGDLTVSDETLMIDDIVAHGPGANYLGSGHTRRHHRDFWQPRLLDQNVYERWQAEGGTTLRDRVRARTCELLASPLPFALDDGVAETLDELTAQAAG